MKRIFHAMATSGVVTLLAIAISTELGYDDLRTAEPASADGRLGKGEGGRSAALGETSAGTPTD